MIKDLKTIVPLLSYVVIIIIAKFVFKEAVTFLDTTTLYLLLKIMEKQYSK